MSLFCQLIIEEIVYNEESWGEQQQIPTKLRKNDHRRWTPTVNETQPTARSVSNSREFIFSSHIRQRHYKHDWAWQQAAKTIEKLPSLESCEVAARDTGKDSLSDTKSGFGVGGLKQPPYQAPTGLHSRILDSIHLTLLSCPCNI